MAQQNTVISFANDASHSQALYESLVCSTAELMQILRLLRATDAQLVAIAAFE